MATRRKRLFGAAPEERMGPLPLHGSGDDPVMPNLAAAQIPGPGTGHVRAGEDGVLPDDVSDPFEQEGHQPAGRSLTGRFRRWRQGLRRA
ncbi:hypothetical protein [Arthrobacter mangrovi]|uniref:hypothetical protein n=1 Tax=Arthrobacter mangrovi TaxID=2966350 RepID=UPI00222FFCE0|nr:hypothetical protein [Arthrobacter mangrovi]